MRAATVDKTSLVRALVDEASDIDLMVYLVRVDGINALKDLLECIRDSECLAISDLIYNITIVRKKKAEALVCPMTRICHRLINPETVPVVSNIPNELSLSASLH